MKVADRTNPSGPYYKDRSQSDRQNKTKKWVRRITKQKKKNGIGGMWRCHALGVGRFRCRQWAGRPEYFRAERTIGSLSPGISRRICILVYMYVHILGAGSRGGSLTNLL